MLHGFAIVCLLMGACPWGWSENTHSQDTAAVERTVPQERVRSQSTPQDASEPTVVPPHGSRQLPDAQRILFLGDSITYSGRYISLLEYAICRTPPERQIELLNLGLPSETVSGLSEPGHAGGQFPRPDLHERLQRVLDQVQPDYVVACYGMNDGIYYPLGEERFAAYQAGIRRLQQELDDRGVGLCLLTPAMFDSLPLGDRVLPEGLDAYPQPYRDYDQVLRTYADWLLLQRGEKRMVLDVHAAMRAAVANERAQHPQFTFAPDGVHPTDAGHEVIARVLADAWGLELKMPTPGTAEAELYEQIAQKQALLKHAWLGQTGHKRPGIPAGVSMESAQQQAEQFHQKIQAIRLRL